MVNVTSARPSGARPVVPAKITSSILPPRSAFAPCSPSTQEIASTTLDLPDPLGPTTQVMPGSKRRVVAEANDLKPFSVRLLRCTTLRWRTAVGRRGERPSPGDGTRSGGNVAAAVPGAPSRPRRQPAGTGAVSSGQHGLGQLGQLPQPLLQIAGFLLGAQS